MEKQHELSGIDLVWWPTLLRSGFLERDRDSRQFTDCLNKLALALADEEV